MGVFTDVMNLVDLGERALLRGEGAEVKEELREGIRQAKRAAVERGDERRRSAAGDTERPPPCARAPQGYRCMGHHDERGNCMTLERIDGAEPRP